MFCRECGKEFLKDLKLKGKYLCNDCSIKNYIHDCKNKSNDIDQIWKYNGKCWYMEVIGEHFNTDVKIKYCPFCGVKL